MTALLVELEGKTLPLTKCSWITQAPCGCVSGIMMAHLADSDHIAATEDQAWKLLYEHETAAHRRRDQAAGFTIRLIASDEGIDLLRRDCEHEPKWGITPRPEVEGMTWAVTDWHRPNQRLHLIESAGVARKWQSGMAPVVALCSKSDNWWTANDHKIHRAITCRRCERKAATS